ncbi:cytochrome P450 [Pusillimonas sp. ANT_WB101]|uniref:cytochrome P450 n=1 Tax=Pusillimonas sp. ANT_WB101 TaxID=2597356 RepID=UPI0011EC50BC|nr:cytochrome P450 [Pusillimonas sp. ANT_WB101]KAA0888518.1 cytochrome P450 [Pusillimonas sp. ANT_WB101]
MLCDQPDDDWNPRAEAVQQDQISAYDEMRGRCPVAHSAYMGWSVFRHDDVKQVLNDHDTFSSRVSRHVSVPNGMDPPEHDVFRRVIEPCFSEAQLQRFAPSCRRVAADLVDTLPRSQQVEFMDTFARQFAVNVQCDYLGWPESLHAPLLNWLQRNQAATLAGDRKLLSALADEFDGYIRTLLDERREAGDTENGDITSYLAHAQVQGRKLTNEEIVSILRNWTAGELGTIAACAGIIAHYLASHPKLPDLLRCQPQHIPAAIDEILRMHAPLVANRRIATKAVELGGRHIQAGDRITLLWASANRDEQVFGDPDEFRLDRDPAHNLLYGAGIHVCPGAGLARMELGILLEALLAGTKQLTLAGEPVRAVYPASGFSSLPMRIN